jgi:hypothetical protein
MSGEMPAFKPEEEPFANLKKPSLSSVPASASAKAEQQKMSLAPTFDRLVEVNIGLTQAVNQLVLSNSRLVRISYLIQITQLVVLISLLVYYLLQHR